MLNQLNTLDHTVMGFLLKHKALTIRAITRMSESQIHKVSKSLEKLMELGFVRRIEYATYPSFAFVLDCPYFPPVAAVAARDFLAFDDKELTNLVDALAPVLAGPSTH